MLNHDEHEGHEGERQVKDHDPLNHRRPARRVHGLGCGLTLLVVALLVGGFPQRSNAACVGDCDGSGDVTVNEIISMVNIALGSAPLSSCPVGDADGSGDITINEIIAAVNNALGVCPPAQASPTPTPATPATATATATTTATSTQAQATLTPTFSVASTFPQIQATIFTPTCLSLSCHNATDQGGGLVLESGAAYGNLVGVTPTNGTASQDGMKRVDPGSPVNSFLITKLTLAKVFDLKLGSRMPSGQPMLSADQIDTIRAWILRGALADESPPAQ